MTAADPLAELLAGRWRDPDTGAPLAVPTRSVVIADTLAGREVALVRDLGLERPYAVVTDANTRAALGARIEAALGSRTDIVPVTLPAGPHADEATVERVRAATADARTIVAIGAGTINDLCKYAAARDGKPYVVFATAPSMNGYTSMNAAITVAGHKKSLAAVAAVGVFMDLEVLAAAPTRMIRAGLGDSIARPTAQADWLLSHLLLGTPYRAAPFALLEGDEDGMLAAPEALTGGDLRVMERLARTLTLSGFGMTICGSSHPASEGEHMISHVVEMMAGPEVDLPMHGEQIAVTTLTMARLQERMLAGPAPALRPTAVEEADLIAYFGTERGRSCWRDFAPKRLDAARAAELNGRLARHWDDWRARIRAVIRPAAELEDVLRRAGAPTRPADLGWPDAFYAEAVRHARLMRDRFTFLDLAAEAGVLDAFIADGA
jgi:glycerol-1-phosphate dehydrogenase [NAD(P)+]